jgi:protein-disulfide isomerase
MHPWARPAAQAGVCLAQQNNDFFWKVHDYVFDNQRELNPQNVTDKIRAEASRIRGFDRKRFDACLSDPKTIQKIDADVAFGSKNGVRGTPSVFVNGHRVTASEPEQLLSIIREAKAAPKTLAQAR